MKWAELPCKGGSPRPRVKRSEEELRKAHCQRQAAYKARGSQFGGLSSARRLPEATESELYRVWDVGACTYFTSQTQGVPSGHLIFVRQGKHGALSLVIVGGRAEDAADDEFTILVRGC